MGERPKREAASKEANLPEGEAEIIGAVHRVEQEDAPHEEQGKVCEVEPEADRLLQPLRPTGQFQKPPSVLPPIEADTLQVAESSKPKEKLYVGRLRGVTRPL